MLKQCPLGQTPGKTSHSFTSGQGQKRRRGKGWSCFPGGSGLPGCPWGGGKEQTQPRGLRNLGGRPENRGGRISVSVSKDFRSPGIPNDVQLSVCNSGGGMNYRGAGSYLHR